MNHCSIAVAAKQLAPLLGQSSIVSPQASVLLQKWFQGPHGPFQPLCAKPVCLKSKIQELVLKKLAVVSALPLRI